MNYVYHFLVKEKDMKYIWACPPDITNLYVVCSVPFNEIVWAVFDAADKFSIFLLDCEFQSMVPAAFECSLVALPWNDYTWFIHFSKAVSLVPFLYVKRKVCHRFSKLHMVLTFKSWFLCKALKRAFYNTIFFRLLIFFFFLKWIKLIFFLDVALSCIQQF